LGSVEATGFTCGDTLIQTAATTTHPQDLGVASFKHPKAKHMKPRTIFFQLSLLAMSACAVGQVLPAVPDAFVASDALMPTRKGDEGVQEKKLEMQSAVRLPYGAGFESRQRGQQAGSQKPVSGRQGGLGRK
jgi:hypothetical protein